MDPLIAGGVLVAGIAIGWSKNQGSDSPAPVVCHCECGAEKTAPIQTHPSSSKEILVIVLLLGLILGAFVVVAFQQFSTGGIGRSPSPKGKGGKGVYGTSIPLPITR